MLDNNIGSLFGSDSEGDKQQPQKKKKIKKEDPNNNKVGVSKPRSNICIM